jgi:hypothetical protein
MIFNNSRKEKKSLQEKKTPIEAKLEFLWYYKMYYPLG